MTVSTAVTIWCDRCGEASLVAEVTTPTPRTRALHQLENDAAGLAERLGWSCRVDANGDPFDHCPDCREHGEVER